MKHRLTASDIGQASTIEVLQDRNDFMRLTTRLCLVVVGTFGVVRGLGYSPLFAPDQLPRAIQIISSSFIPLGVWSLAWVIAGLIAFAASFRVNPAGSGGVVGLSLGWAVGYTVSWIMTWGNPATVPPDPSVRDYLGASFYWTVALLLIGGQQLSRWALLLGALLVLQAQELTLARSHGDGEL